MQVLRKMSKHQPHLPWLIGTAVVSLVILIVMVSVTMGEAPRIGLPALHPSDWVLAIAGGLAIPATMVTYWALQFLPQPKPRLQQEEPVQEQPVYRHIVLNTPHAKPEVVLRLTQERDEGLRQAAEWKRLHNELQQKYAQAKQVQLVPLAPEPERELTYAAVAALLKSGNVGIKAAIEIVRANGGMVGRRGYEDLKALLPLLPLSPIAKDAPDSRDFLTVNREPETVNPSVNQNRRARLPRKKRGW